MNELEMIFEVRKEIYELKEYTEKRIKILLIKIIKLEKNVNEKNQ